RSPIVVNNATGRLYVQVYGTSVALEFDGIPCFGAKNASPCTSDHIIDSGNTYNQKIAQTIGGALIKYGYFSLIESLGGYAILTIQTGPNDPYLACVMTKIADDDNIADSFATPSATTAYTATSVALGVVCLALAAGGVVTVATAGKGGSADVHPGHHYYSEHWSHHNPEHSYHHHPDHLSHNHLEHSSHHPNTNQLDHHHDTEQLDSHPKDIRHFDNAPPGGKEIHQGGDMSIQINGHSAGNVDTAIDPHQGGGGNGVSGVHDAAKGDIGGKETDVVDYQVAGGSPPH
ncbi:464_t:CDS:2, partial [Dentiscutata heterogama]